MLVTYGFIRKWAFWTYCLALQRCAASSLTLKTIVLTGPPEHSHTAQAGHILCSRISPMWVCLCQPVLQALTMACSDRPAARRPLTRV